MKAAMPSRPPLYERIQPIAQWSPPASPVGILTDIDDTLTTDGAITSNALNAIAALQAAGLHVIPVTGRPVGWSEPFVVTWPVNAIVAENGAVALLPGETNSNSASFLRNTGKRHQLSKIYQQDAATRITNYARMQAVLAQIEQQVHGALRATDSAGRETDIAIDHSEFTHLPQERIDHAVRIMRAAGMSATVSSIHINGWYGSHNKLEGARWIVRELFGRDLDAEMDRWVYVGDSTNDQIMFQHFPHSIGVANIARFVPQLKHLPRYVTQGERGAGFAEVANAILSQKDR